MRTTQTDTPGLTGEEPVRDGHSARLGFCHRCGWHDFVHRVRRRQRHEQSPSRLYRWLCDECAADLASAKPQRRQRDPATTDRKRAPGRAVA